MNLNSLPRIVTKKKRRLGLGHGSMRGKTAGRGTKGQKARGKIPIRFEGGALPLMKRLPFRRGRNKNKSLVHKKVVINVKLLNVLPKGTVVDLDTLITHRFVDKKEATSFGVKILGDGELAIPLTVKLPVSQGAKVKIEKAGGSIQS